MLHLRDSDAQTGSMSSPRSHSWLPVRQLGEFVLKFLKVRRYSLNNRTALAFFLPSFFFLPYHTAYTLLLTRAGVEPGPLSVNRVLTTGLPENSLYHYFMGDSISMSTGYYKMLGCQRNPPPHILNPQVVQEEIWALSHFHQKAANFPMM